MTAEDAAMILTLLKTAYPSSYSRLTAQDARETVGVWAYMFSDEPGELVAAAVKAIIAEQTGEFAPSIGAVKQKIRELTTPEAMTAQEAWILVSRAAANCDLLDPEPEFRKLPADVQRAVGSPRQLRDWGLVEEGAFQTVVASNFRRTWEAQQKRDAAKAALPAELRELVAGLADRLALDSHAT